MMSAAAMCQLFQGALCHVSKPLWLTFYFILPYSNYSTT